MTLDEWLKQSEEMLDELTPPAEHYRYPVYQNFRKAIAVIHGMEKTLREYDNSWLATESFKAAERIVNET